MAEEEKTEAGKLESEDGKGNTEVKKENGVAASPVKHDATESREPSSSVNGKENSVQETKVNGVEKHPVAPMNGAGECPTGTPGKETVLKEVDSKELNDGKTETKPEEGQDDNEPEGSKCLYGEHGLCGWVEHKLGISCNKTGHVIRCCKM